MNATVEQLEEKRDVLMDSIHAKYLEHLREGICRVTFTKKDGTERQMLCTLDMSGIPEEHQPKTDGNATAKNNEAVRVYDLEKEAWRSFRLDSVTVFDPTV
jgi:hypothetical protein